MTKEELLSRIELEDSFSTKSFNKEELTKELNKEKIVNKRDCIFRFYEKYGNIIFRKIEKQSGDRILFNLSTNGYLSFNWSEMGINVLQIGGYYNCAGDIEVFYMSEDGLFYNQDKKLIADNEDDFFNYILTVEYDYHPVIADSTYKRLKDAGWYEGRQIDITQLVIECKAHGVYLSEKQKDFVREFGGIKGIDVDDEEFEILAERKYDYYKRPKCAITSNPNITRMIYMNYGAEIVCVGCCGDGMIPLWLTSDGRLITDDSHQIGRTIMEGFNCFLGYK